MDKFFLIVIMLFIILYGIAKAKLQKAQKSAKEAQQEAAKTEVEKETVTASASVYEAMVKELDSASSKVPSIAASAKTAVDTPAMEAGAASIKDKTESIAVSKSIAETKTAAETKTEFPDIEISIPAQEQAKEALKRLRRIRGL